MWYVLIRIILGLMLAVGLFFLIKKGGFKKKRIISICGAIVILVLITLLALVPIENIFVNFSSPEKVFKYSTNGSIDKIIEGQQSALIIYKNNEASSLTIIPKGNNGWKIGTYFSYKELSSKTVNKRIINVYNAKNTDDYYVTVWDSFATDIGEITDSKGTTFEHIAEENEATSTKNVSYFAYVNNLGKDYTITINGENVSLIS